MAEEKIELENLSGKDFFKAAVDIYGRNHEMRIIPPKKYDTPKNFNLDKYPKEAREDVESAVNNLTEYLSLPVIWDNFENHNQRRAWRRETYAQIVREYGQEKADEFDKYLGKNKMKRNKLSQVYGWTDFIKEYLPKDKVDEFSQAILATTPKDKAHDPWEGPTTEDKIKKVEKISEMIVGILNHLSQA